MLHCRHFIPTFDPDKASLSAGRFMVMRIKYLLDRKEDFCIETTLSSRTLTNTIEIARQYGYSITILFFWIENVELAISRVKARVTAGGHNVPEATIRRRYRSGLRHFFEDYMPMSDRWMLADNTTVPFKLIAQGWKNNMVVQDNIKFEAIKAQAERFRKEDVSR